VKIVFKLRQRATRDGKKLEKLSLGRSAVSLPYVGWNRCRGAEGLSPKPAEVTRELTTKLENL
jgi:hypothetical protein